MKFDYTVSPARTGLLEELFPLLEVTLVGSRARFRTHALLDSGAQVCMLPLAVATRIGATPTGDKTDLEGIVPGQKFRAADFYELDATFGNGRFKTRIPFAAHPNVKYAVLGHRGFFLRYWVAFDARELAFYVDDL